jgi:hypothetical protein
MKTKLLSILFNNLLMLCFSTYGSHLPKLYLHYLTAFDVRFKSLSLSPGALVGVLVSL